MLLVLARARSGRGEYREKPHHMRKRVKGGQSMSTKETTEANPRRLALALGAAALATLIGGCYIGKAEFKGEDMKMYPLFGMSAEATP